MSQTSTSRVIADLPLVEPGRGYGLLDVFRQRYLLHLIVRKDLRVRYRGSVLGLAWSYVKPAIQFVVFYVALGIFLELNKGTQSYAVYLFSGIVAINLFGEAFGNVTRSVTGNGHLIKKIYLPRELFGVSAVWVAVVHFLPQILVLCVGALLVAPDHYWAVSFSSAIAFVLGFLIICFLSLGFGLMFGAINVFFRDAENFVDLIMMVVTWLSPIMYTWTKVRDALIGIPIVYGSNGFPAPKEGVAGGQFFLDLYQSMPLTVAVELFHFAFWVPATTPIPNNDPVRCGPADPYACNIQDPSSWVMALPDNLFWHGLVALAISLFVLFLGQLVFRRLEGRFAQEL